MYLQIKNENIARLPNVNQGIQQKSKVIFLSIYEGFFKKKTDLLFDVFKWRGWDDRETYEEHVCLWITEGTQTVIIFLSWKQQQSKNEWNW